MNRLLITVAITLLSFKTPGFANFNKSGSIVAEKSVNEAEVVEPAKTDAVSKKSNKVYYGIASYYADKFRGRKTATGKVYRHRGETAACNRIPLGTWIRVTNLRNKKSVVVKVNDRMNRKNKRLVDLSKSGATKLGYVSRGLTKVKVEVLGKKKPKSK